MTFKLTSPSYNSNNNNNNNNNKNNNNLQVRDYLHISDLSRGHVRALQVTAMYYIILYYVILYYWATYVLYAFLQGGCSAALYYRIVLYYRLILSCAEGGAFNGCFKWLLLILYYIILYYIYIILYYIIAQAHQGSLSMAASMASILLILCI